MFIILVVPAVLKLFNVNAAFFKSDYANESSST